MRVVQTFCSNGEKALEYIISGKFCLIAIVGTVGIIVLVVAVIAIATGSHFISKMVNCMGQRGHVQNQLTVGKMVVTFRIGR